MKRFIVAFETVEHKQYTTVVSAESRDDVLQKLEKGEFEVQDEEWLTIIDNHDSWEPRSTESFELKGVQCEELTNE